jgi:hypothetical protein
VEYLSNNGNLPFTAFLSLAMSLNVTIHITTTFLLTFNSKHNLRKMLNRVKKYMEMWRCCLINQQAFSGKRHKIIYANKLERYISFYFLFKKIL